MAPEQALESGRNGRIGRPRGAALSLRHAGRMAWVGTSGWSYEHLETVLYPPGTTPRQRLALYTQEFFTVELNASCMSAVRFSSSSCRPTSSVMTPGSTTF